MGGKEWALILGLGTAGSGAIVGAPAIASSLSNSEGSSSVSPSYNANRQIISSSADTEGRIITDIKVSAQPPETQPVRTVPLFSPRQEPMSVFVPPAPAKPVVAAAIAAEAIRPPAQTSNATRKIESPVPAAKAVAIPSSPPAASPKPPIDRKVDPAPQSIDSYILPESPLAGYRQKYTLSCEVASVKIALAYWQNSLAGVDMSEEKLQEVLGVNPDPNIAFRGDYRSDPKGLQNYGAHAPAIKRLVETYPKPGMFKGEVLRSIDQVKAAVKQNKPVLVWVTFGLGPSHAENGLVPGEHVMVVRGFDGKGNFQVYDPEYTNNVGRGVPENLIANRMSLFAQPALAVSPNS